MKIEILIEKINKKERKRFLSFLNSPYFFQSDRFLRLWKAILKYEGLQKWDKHLILKEAFPERVFTTDKEVLKFFNDRIYDLSQIILKFFQMEYLRNNEEASSDILLKAFQQRKIDALQLKLLKQKIEGLEVKKSTSSSALASYWYLQNEHFFTIQNKITSSERKHQTILLANTIDDLYLVNKLRITIELIFKHKKNKSNIEVTIPDDILQLAKSNINSSILLQLYIGIYELMKNNTDSEKLDAIANLFFKNEHKLDVQDRIIIITRLVSITLHIMNTIDRKYNSLLFKLYKIGIEKDILRTKETITTGAYMNITAVGVSTYEFEWTRSFIEENKKRLPKKYQDDIYNLCYGNLYLFEGKYKKAINHLVSVHSKERLIQLRQKNYLLRAYYFELCLGNEELDKAWNKLIKNYKKFLNTVVLQSNLKTEHQNLIIAITKLCNFYLYGYGDPASIISEITELKPIANPLLIDDELKKLAAM